MSDTGSEHDSRFEKRVEERAALLPEERVAGSDDPEAQAEAILTESDDRLADPGRTGAPA